MSSEMPEKYESPFSNLNLQEELGTESAGQLDGLSLGTEDWIQSSNEDYSESPFAGLSLYAEEGDEEIPVPLEKPPSNATPEANATAETPVSAAKAVPHQRSVTELAPEELEETLIVGDFCLNSGDSQHQQEESMLNYLIKNALMDQVSAIHLEPQDRYLRVRHRIDGVLHQKTALPQNLGMPMLARLKQLCALNAETMSLPQHNRVQARFNDIEFELGLATYPTVWGESMVISLRLKQKQANNLLRLENTGLSRLNLWRLQKLLSQPEGLLVVTGPVRSGKTTTLYATLNALNLLTRSIVTAENPMEQMIMGITQGNWAPESGLSYGDLIRSMGPLDPDVLMVSHVNSPEILEATVEQALGGAKVLTSYHSFDTMGALLRLVSQGLESYLIASSNVALLSQRLVRKLCSHCRQADTPPRGFLDALGLTAVEPESFPVYRARGCAECNQVGYSGQTAIHELLVLNEALREALLDRKPAAVLRDIARNEAKLVAMTEDGYAKAVEGVTSLSEVQRVAFINEFDSRSSWEAEKIITVCKGENKKYI